MRILAGIYQTGLFFLGLALWVAKLAVYIWSGAFLLIVGALAFVSAFFGTVIFFALAVEVLRVYYPH